MVGNEAHGLPDDASRRRWVTIRHRGRAESLNVAMAATVVVLRGGSPTPNRLRSAEFGGVNRLARVTPHAYPSARCTCSDFGAPGGPGNGDADDRSARQHLSPSGEIPFRPFVASERTPVIDDIRAARDAAARPDRRRRRSSTRSPTLGASLLGKRGELAQLKTKLGALATVDEKRAAGQAVNEAMERRRRRDRRRAGPSSPVRR